MRRFAWLVRNELALSTCRDHALQCWLVSRRFASTDTARGGKRSYVDRLRVVVQAGDGGTGCATFWRSAAKGTQRALYLAVFSNSLPNLRAAYDLQASTLLQTVAEAAEVVMCWCRRPPGGSK